MTRPAVADTCLRLALVAMAVDSTSPLTPDQRTWIARLSRERRALPPEARGRLKAPLLAWAKDHMPGCVEVLTAQFAEEPL